MVVEVATTTAQFLDCFYEVSGHAHFAPSTTDPAMHTSDGRTHSRDLFTTSATFFSACLPLSLSSLAHFVSCEVTPAVGVVGCWVPPPPPTRHISRLSACCVALGAEWNYDSSKLGALSSRQTIQSWLVSASV